MGQKVRLYRRKGSPVGNWEAMPRKAFAKNEPLRVSNRRLELSEKYLRKLWPIFPPRPIKIRPNVWKKR